MNPLPLVVAELRRNAMGCAAVIALIAVAVALSVALCAQERALRVASARAAERFDLIVGAPGGRTQPVLSTVYLQPAALNELDAVLGNVHDLLRSVTFAFDGLLVTAVILVIVAVLSGRRQSIGVLRALGATPAFLFVTVWLQGALLIGVGVLVGLPAGFALAKAISAIASYQLGFAVDATIGEPELSFAAVLLLAGSSFAAAPSLPFLRVPAARLLRLA